MPNGARVRLPFFKLFPDEFSSDGRVEAMSKAALGCHVLLMCKSWREDPVASIPDDDVILAKWARVLPDKWLEVRDEVLAAWTPRDGRFHHRALRAQYEVAISEKKSMSDAGKRGASKRWHGSEKQGASPQRSEMKGPHATPIGIAVRTPSETPSDGSRDRVAKAPPSHIRRQIEETHNTGSDDEESDQVVCVLIQQGFTAGRATDWANAGCITLERLRAFVVAADRLSDAGRLHSRTGYLRDAIEKGWDPPVLEKATRAQRLRLVDESEKRKLADEERLRMQRAAEDKAWFDQTWARIGEHERTQLIDKAYAELTPFMRRIVDGRDGKSLDDLLVRVGVNQLLRARDDSSHETARHAES